MDERLVNRFLERIRTEGRSSPTGQQWAAFHDLLCRHALRVGVERPPVPLILAASGEASSSKHQRLSAQLHWAQVNGVLTEALQFLADLQQDQWNHCAAQNWHRSDY